MSEPLARDGARLETILITGASAGIGLELARICAAERNARLVLVARREDRLRALADEIRSAHGTPVEVIATDLGAEGGADALAAELERRGLAIDVLVNNAGFGQLVPFVGQEPARFEEMIRLNVTALTALTRHLVPAMVARRRGLVLNVASTAAFVAGPWMAVYYATKAYVLSFSVALADELRGTGVTVSALCPGPTTSEFQAVAGMDRAKVFSTRLLAVMDARSVAEIGWRGARRGKTIVVAGFLNRLSVLALRLAPRTLASRLVRGINDPG